MIDAKLRGAKIIHIDPRFTRTSALADLHVPIRAGTDIALLGGLINYVLSEGEEFREYVVAYTNAAAIISEDYRDTEDLDGLFSGWDPEQGAYDVTTWRYEDGGSDHRDGPRHKATAGGDRYGSGGASVSAKPPRDETLQHPRCVFQILRRHYARYTPELVEQVCGIPRETFLEVARSITRNSGRERTTNWSYAVGWTQHSVGVQYIRAASILQALLGNIGRPGGGILALRGHASIQGSTDIPTLFNILPGYLPMPVGSLGRSLADYVAPNAGVAGFWGDMPSYIVSLLKAWFGDAASAENDYGFGWLPRLTGDHNNYRTVLDMVDGRVPGYIVAGENPAVGGANARMQRLGLAKLEWLVVRDMTCIETATFWKNSPEVESGELRTEDIGTEVFFLPAAGHVEKEGTFTNTQRLLQWRHKAVEPPDDARSDLGFFYHLGRIIKERLAGSDDPRDASVRALTWDYPVQGPKAEPSGAAVLQEINGRGRDGELLSAYTQLRDDGSTSCGCWIYCGVYADGINQAARRKPVSQQDWVAAEWGWAWPANRRQLYNRASADPEGKPWSGRKALIWWDGTHWTGKDVPDFPPDKPPDYIPPPGAKAGAALAGDDPFIMQTDGKAWLFAPVGLVDGPLPTHYEPVETPHRNLLHPEQPANPAAVLYDQPGNRHHPVGSAVFPYVLTTFRLTEHHTGGGMSRHLSYLAELQPEAFCEVSPELARERGLTHLGWATLVTARSAVEFKVLVTERLRPVRVEGRETHQIGVPWHYGPNGLATGDSANDLLSITLDPNVHIQESKVLTCDIRPGRRPHGHRLQAFIEGYRRRAGIES
ncbi:MAG: molybdopterin-dependent oxidoreductase [Pseudonocardiales bacterium]|nr:molybdopterin-dependent oxidoreductase [Pseudonocardiales bacterium]